MSIHQPIYMFVLFVVQFLHINLRTFPPIKSNLHKTLFKTIIATVTPIIRLHVEIALRRADAWDCGSQCAAQRDDDAKAVGEFEVE